MLVSIAAVAGSLLMKLTNVRRLAVWQLTLRGRKVEISWDNGTRGMGSVPPEAPRRIRDARTGKVLRWRLSAEEEAALQDMMLS
jgi:hypothetical protein